MRVVRVIVASLLACLACATPGADTLEEVAPIRLGAKIEVGAVTDATHSVGEIDAQALLRNALETSLQDAGLLWSGSPFEDHYKLELEVVEYEPGSAFKRWLLPGYGATILRVHGSVLDAKNAELAAEIDHQRSVIAGGAYTIGAWKWIFASVAKDIVRDLQNHTRAQGFFVTLAPWASHHVEVPRAAAPRDFSVESFVDRRPDRGRVGERTAAFGTSMGDIHIARDPSDLLREAVIDDLHAAGHRVDAAPNAIAMEGELLRFWVRTDTTAVYWDVVAQIELRLTFRAAGAAGTPRSATQSCEHRERTYTWPTKSLVEDSLDACLADLMAAVRQNLPTTSAD